MSKLIILQTIIFPVLENSKNFKTRARTIGLFLSIELLL